MQEHTKIKWSPYACWQWHLLILGSIPCLKNDTLDRIKYLAGTLLLLVAWVGHLPCCGDVQNGHNSVRIFTKNHFLVPWGEYCYQCLPHPSGRISHYLHLQSLHFFSWIPFSESIPMKSLSCYNDYNSQVTCTWMEHSEAHALVGMTLYQRDNILMWVPEMSCVA